MYARIAILLLLPLLVPACAAEKNSPTPYEVPEDALLNQPLSELPPLLSQTGLFAALPSRKELAPTAVPYAPAWPLWSSGSLKTRSFVLPEGTQIDNSDPEGWVFPVGTLVFKTFSFPEEDGSWSPVETRLMRKIEDDWEYEVYQWNEERTDATLISIQLKTPVTAIGPDGQTFEHTIPSRLQCRKCHESNPTRIIGISELQLAAAEDGETPQITDLAEQGYLLHPPTNPLPAIIHANPLTRDVMGYMQGSCVHCHNGGDGPATSFDLRHEVMLENTVDMPTEGSGSADGIRVVPGHPEESILFVGFSGETTDQEVKMMPPLGAEKMDVEGVELFRNWIESLEDAPFIAYE